VEVRMSALLIGLIPVALGSGNSLPSRDLEKHGVHVSYLWLRVMILKYLNQYRRITLEETGCVGSLFYHYVIPLNMALVLTIILVILMFR
jgi:hypothetical protein